MNSSFKQLTISSNLCLASKGKADKWWGCEAVRRLTFEPVAARFPGFLLLPLRLPWLFVTSLFFKSKWTLFSLLPPLLDETELIALVLAERLVVFSSDDPRLCPTGLDTRLEEREDLVAGDCVDPTPRGELLRDVWRLSLFFAVVLSPGMVTFRSIIFSRTFVPSNSIFFRFTYKVMFI